MVPQADSQELLNSFMPEVGHNTVLWHFTYCEKSCLSNACISGSFCFMFPQSSSIIQLTGGKTSRAKKTNLEFYQCVAFLGWILPTTVTLPSPLLISYGSGCIQSLKNLECFGNWDAYFFSKHGILWGKKRAFLAKCFKIWKISWGSADNQQKGNSRKRGKKNWEAKWWIMKENAKFCSAWNDVVFRFSQYLICHMRQEIKPSFTHCASSMYIFH